ncbi:MAG TPA: hypothetical protein VMU33_04210 [Burkholderiaceae bacterium]|nr:hypothetical protein [Burkholderiaceae bacterium]
MERLETSRRIARLLALDPELSGCGVDFERPGSCELRDRTLRLSARSASERAKLRQMAPALQRALAAHGFEGIEIKLQVQPGHIDYRNSASSEKTLDSGTADPERPVPRLPELAAMKAFAEKLVQTAANPGIRASAERMYRAITQRLANMRDDNRAENPDRGDGGRS